MNEWYELKEESQLDSPALVIYPQRVKANIEKLVSMIDSKERLRPHVKTNKSSEACKLMMEAGISKFKAATISELEMLASVNAQDVLLAYQPVGPKLQRFIELIRTYPATRFSCLIDHPLAANEMNVQFSSNRLRVPVFVDLNVGMNRTGIQPGNNAIQLYNNFVNAQGILPIGLHVYDGHIHSTDFNRRNEVCDSSFEPVLKMRDALTEKLIPEPVIIAGGTPTFPIHARRAKIECSPGTFIYWDKGYIDLCHEQDFLPAALVITRVISVPDRNRVCVDLGHKSIASESDIKRRVYFFNAPDLEPVAHSEEHLVLQTTSSHTFKTGDVLYGLPYHICPTIALYERAAICYDGNITGEWKNVARDKKMTI